MFEALFILTTVDAGTRVGRFMLQDTLGNLWKPIARVSWWPGLVATSAVVVAAWGYFLYQGVNDPLGRHQPALPLFGIANQLLAAVALTVATTLLIKSGRLKWAWVTGVPLAWDVAVTLTASYQKVFSPDPGSASSPSVTATRPRSTRDSFSRRAKTTGAMQQIVVNSTVDGILAALFAILIIVVIVDAARVWIKAIRAQEPLPDTEAPFEESKLYAPPGSSPPARRRRRWPGPRQALATAPWASSRAATRCPRTSTRTPPPRQYACAIASRVSGPAAAASRSAMALACSTEAAKPGSA
ncbi:hypothetical protein GCM10020220_000350 [Nonomuraea rubra]|uniref:carbon starvation CstA family protein n=1 Tax=Nonomuraea rubra TaxID=46180 RepID=UPI0031F1A553